MGKTPCVTDTRVSHSSRPGADSICSQSASAMTDVELYLVSPAGPGLALGEKLGYAWYEPNNSGFSRAYHK